MRAAAIALAIITALVVVMGCEETLPPQSAPTPTQPTPTPEPTPVDAEYRLGLILTDEEAYRSASCPSADQVSVPQSVDLSPDMPRPGDQGKQGSCTAWAVAYAMKSYQERVERGWPLANDLHVMSPAYIYNQRSFPNGKDLGMSYIDAFNLLVNQGVASLALMPYNDEDHQRQPSSAAKREAASYKISGWSCVNDDNLEREIKRHLKLRRPVLIGIKVFQDLYDLCDGTIGLRCALRRKKLNPVYDDTSGEYFGRHAVVVVGYDDRKSAFKIINSWGTDWGSNGYGWIDYNTSKQVILEAFVTNDMIADDLLPEAATDPRPTDATGGTTPGTVRLEWTPNDRTTSFDVYVGVERGSIDFQGNVSEPTFTARVVPGTTYYWRVDARGPGGSLTQGQVWSFTTSGSIQTPLAPTNPRPADGAAAVPVDGSLSWDSGGRATSYDVYLDTTPTLGGSAFQRTTATRHFRPAELEPGTQYYWRVDAKNGLGSTPSDTWSFTTAGPVPALSIADASATEGQALSFAVTVSPAASSTVTVSYRTANGTASSPLDYTSASGTLTFRAGDTSKTISVRTIDDNVVESQREAFTVLLSSASGATISDDSATGTINDNDGTLPSLSIADASATEGQTLSFAVTLSSAASSTVTVSYRTANGTASSSSDYTAVSGTLTFRAGDTRKTISVGTTDDTRDESNETFTVRLSSASGATISDDSATGTINDNDGSQPSLSIADASATEGRTLSFAVTLSPAASSTVTVSYRTSSGTASSSSDYTAASGTLTFRAGDTRKTISVRTTDDTRDESNETFTVRLSSASGATISDDSATGTINDSDGTLPSLSIADASATEGQTLSFAVTLSSAASSTVTVSYRTSSGTASGSSDYTAVSGTLSFAAGDTRKTISVRTTDDTRDESNETFTVRLSSASGATISDDSATGTINDNDGTPSLSIADASATEGRPLSFTVRLSAASSRTVTVDYQTWEDTASRSEDFRQASGTLSFAAGDTRKTISVGTIDDSLDESNETFTVRLRSPSGATISDRRATGTIENDDDPGNTRNSADSGSLSSCGSSNGSWRVEGYLSSNDYDYFKIVCDDARGKLTAYTTGRTDTRGMLQYGNGATAVAEDDNSGSGNNFRVARPGTIGTYYIRVRGDSTTGSYVLRVLWRPYDAPDSWSSAENLSGDLRIGSPVSRPFYLSGGSDTDWFFFDILGSGCSTVDIKSKIESRLSGISAFTRTDPQMHLYSGRGSGRSIGYDNNSGTGNHFSERVVLRNGRTYYIKVTNRNSHKGPYTLEVIRSNGPFLCIGAVG